MLVNKTLNIKSSEKLESFNLLILDNIFLTSSPSESFHMSKLKLFSCGSNNPTISDLFSSSSVSAILIDDISSSLDKIGLSIVVFFSSLTLLFSSIFFSCFFHISTGSSSEKLILKIINVKNKDKYINLFNCD